ncbi:chromosome alignment-maintaining phosphoprotein 1 [Microtus oregoni]|uniref:chromosome alignment-maintaining phosphoprotein 1 n=1 Tax=Microtus oregoni TaxID=111838 RepID=UPI001BB2701C|nr:chromosome alignment-maintaining phosphoprotein 1 [Microtus oregoni]XP_041529862.1 chromosome alignment-maintaining phosphoprotein 1 [Microtus oregoni]XP_041529863.1 chromosome alignment-maintaining phosphoprotein 1 [Microtus oregoni]XP_041529864.1 chromosome alignment-maintaining phosphoprotein 1 [Microtus oregoni]XP_041529865.1 chromosome alignment-maintaining phosphoprotein 1 [Microtus oregoni]XP_041529866.1 chromosome alignment-maintaining phosphoprotein 1 [Microtus oregoni]
MEVCQEPHKPSLSLDCDHCGFRGTDYENVQIHMGSIHPEFCDDMDAGGLGKMIFYQKSAKLFHCHQCFFTSKMYSNVYYHITAKHAASEKWRDKPKDQLSKETETVESPSLPEHQSTALDPAEVRPTPALPMETQKIGPSLSPEPQKSVPPALEPEDSGPVVSPEQQAPCLPAEASKTASVSSPECVDPASMVSELQKPAPASPESVKSALVSSKPQKHSPFADTGAPPSTLSPESPVLATSPEPWGPSLTASPESRKPTRTASPEPRKPSPSESPELWKPFPAVTSEPRRPTPAVSPGSWKPGPPGSPRPWKSSPSATSGPWKSSKPAPSLSPGPWKPIPSVSSGPWKPAPSVSTASWKSSVSSGSWKTPPTSPESWKSGPPELRKTALALSPEHWKAVPPVSPELRRPGPPLSPEIRSPAGSPELRKPSGSPDLWKLSPDQRKSSPASLDFPESQKSSRGSPDVWKSSFITESQKPSVFPETRKHPSGSSEPPKVASDIWKPVLSLDAEARKSTLFPEPTKAVLPASPEPRKRAFFPEPRKHVLFPELPKSAVISNTQKATELGDELQLEAVDDAAKCDSLVQEGLLAAPKKLLEDALFPPSKKLKKDSQENSDAELSSSEYLRTDLDAIDIKGQESSSDQEQVDVESIDFGKENKMEMSSPEQSKNVLQFTEEKEAFISEEEIAKYMKRGKGKYYCKICCCRAMKKGAVLHHLVNKHNVHSPYKCTICGKAFLLESLLKNHVAAHGQSLLKCPRCNFESNFPRGFKKHLTHCQSRFNEEANKKLMEALESPLEEPQM